MPLQPREITAGARLEKAPLICKPAPVPTFATLERRRKELNISVDAMLHAAGVHKDVWWFGKAGKVATRPSSLRRLADALDRLAAGGASRSTPPALIAAFVNVAGNILRHEIVRPELIVACYPKRAPRKKPPAVLPEHRIRSLAIYLVTVELQVENVDVANAIGCSRQNVKQLRDEIEDLREDPLVDRLLERVARSLKGQGRAD